MSSNLKIDEEIFLFVACGSFSLQSTLCKSMEWERKSSRLKRLFSSELVLPVEKKQRPGPLKPWPALTTSPAHGLRMPTLGGLLGPAAFRTAHHQICIPFPSLCSHTLCSKANKPILIFFLSFLLPFFPQIIL